METGEEAVFDLDTLLRQLAGDMELCREVVGDFDEDFRAGSARIKAYLANDDGAGAASEAHSIKGAAGTLCAKPLAEAAARVETLARDGDIAQAAIASDALCEAYEKLYAAFRDTEVI